MKKILFVVAGVFLISSIASAADVNRGHIMATKSSASLPFSWDGVYIGGNFGTGIGDQSGVRNSQTVTGGLAGVIGTIPGDNNSRMRGWVYGGQIGVNKQFGAIVTGIEAEFDWSTIKANAAAASSSPATAASSQSAQDLKWLGLVQARLGVAAGRFMPFVSGGVAFGKVQTDVATQATNFGITCLVGCGSAQNSATKTGWTIGGGLEAALDRNWSFKAQYNYVDLGSVSGSYAGTGTTFGPGTTSSSFAYNSDYKFHIIKTAINYRF